MTRLSRTRSRVHSTIGPGTIQWNAGGPVYTEPAHDINLEINSDWYGTPWNDSTFDLRRSYFPRVHLNGDRPYLFFGFLTYWYVRNVPLWGSIGSIYTQPWTQEAVMMPGQYSNVQLAQMALANLNPNRPNVDLPVSIVELRELPELLRDAGRILFKNNHLVKRAAKANLVAQFGIVPIVSDIGTLLDFTELVARREADLRRMNTVKPIRIKRKITQQHWAYTWANYEGWNTNATGSTTTGKVNLTYAITKEYWYSVRARLSVLLSEREIQSHAFRIMMGTDTGSLKQVWELLPWSWLIDWFTNMGDILAAYRGGLPFEYEGLCLMAKTDYHATVTFPNGLPPGLSTDVDSPQGNSIRKQRTPIPVVWAFPQFRLPYLTNGQLSILSSLLTLRL